MQLLRDYFKTLPGSEDPLSCRKKAWDRFLAIGLPTFKQEAFQYLSLKSLFFPRPALSPLKIEEPSLNSLLFIDGFFQSAHLPQPLICLKLDAALLVYGAFLQNRIDRALKDETDPFAAMNGAFQGQSVFLYVPPDTHVQQPIEIHHRSTSTAMASPRLQIFLGQGASLQLIQRSSSSVFCNSYIDVNLDAGSSFFFGDSQSGALDSISFQAFRCSLKRDSRLHYLSVGGPANLARLSIKVQLLEENSEALLQGLNQGDAERESHVHTTVEHIAPQTRSRQHFKAILRGRCRSSFEGKIVVRPEAQKTEAYQLNNHLLLSDEALEFAKPNLEIFADDVKASHGATVSQLNEEELFYFRARGIPLSIAQEMLTTGFCNEILRAVPAGISL